MKLAILLIALCSMKYANAATGKATFYGGNPSGNACGFSGVNTATFPYGYYAAIGSTNFDDGYGCGKCYKVKCTGAYGNNPSCHCGANPEVVVQALDQCPECSASHFDLNPTAMAKIVGTGLSGTCGVISIEYERVDCQMAGNFIVRNKAGTSKWWYGLHLEDVTAAGGISSVELYKNGAKVGFCTKNQGPSFWICTASNGNFPDAPLTIKITSDAGTTATAADCITNYNGNARFQCTTNLGGGVITNPTPQPVTSVTREPTSKPNSGNSGGNKIKVNNKKGLNQWWYAVVLDDIDYDSIEWVKMKASNTAGFEKGTQEWDYFFFNNNGPYEPPFSFKIKSNGVVLRTDNVILTLNEGDSGYMDSSFADAFIFETEEGTDSMSWTGVFAIVFLVILCIGAVGIAGYCFMKKKKEKGAVSFTNNNNDDNIDDTPVVDKKDGKDAITSYDMSPINTGRGDEEEEEEEIEIDVEIEEKPTPSGHD